MKPHTTHTLSEKPYRLLCFLGVPVFQTPTEQSTELCGQISRASPTYSPRLPRAGPSTFPSYENMARLLPATRLLLGAVFSVPFLADLSKYTTEDTEGREGLFGLLV